ncbi:MAG: substrate-binding domain-containing protein [Clostridiales bacterium]
MSKNINMKKLFILVVILFLILFVLSFNKNEENIKNTKENMVKNNDEILYIDGSAAVYPIMELTKKLVKAKYLKGNSIVSSNNTSIGMEKFIEGKIDICTASRLINEKEMNLCKENKIMYEEYKIAYDGIVIIVNKNNKWIYEIEEEDLSLLWKNNSRIKKWTDVEEKFPNKKMIFYTKEKTSGIYECFKNQILNDNPIRSDINIVKDEKIIIEKIVNNKYAIGFLSYPQYSENKDDLRAIKIISENTIKGVSPTKETIKDDSYYNLKRPLYIYVNKESKRKSQMKAFLEYFFENEDKLVELSGYIPVD